MRPGKATTGARSLAPHVEPVRAEAVRRFEARHPGLELAPVVVVIAALDERGAIEDVVRRVPRPACGLPVDTIVVDDGSSDGTGEAAERAGALVARLERNCGHGVALRLGYALARDHGARYLVTLDGDGQWDPADLARVLEPVVRDQADFAIGSRVLGAAETDDRYRQVGVHVFSLLVRVLTGVRVTDTS
ncbi:MAG TPA: glycosyltransferase family 2 protein, partial [Solirubrobacteraceae bacterium]|nr:glycosyltransferase family 2 protein [Solirubrobacteraceae bacterium]